MTKTRKPLPPATIDILVSLLDGPAHGYGIKKSIESRTEGRSSVRAATLYEALHRLDQGRLIEEVAAAPQADDGATSRWRFYRLTQAGESALRSELLRMDEIVRHARTRGLALQRDVP
jgi:DNA-binding PadR family transcriptional regulator